MLYVKRNAEGHIVALSRDAGAVAGIDGWREADEGAPEVIAFGEAVAGGADALRRSDLGFVRVLEDVIDLLVERSLIRFTDLPPAAQAKLMERRNARADMRSLTLLDDADDVI